MTQPGPRRSATGGAARQRMRWRHRCRGKAHATAHRLGDSARVPAIAHAITQQQRSHRCARTDLSGLSAAEAQALFLLVGPAAAVSDEAKAALRKLVRALPSTFRADAEAAASATVIDPTRWGERDRSHPPLVDQLQEAVIRRRKVRLTYTSSARARSERLIDPWGLAAKDEIWYLIAGTERGQRTFRVDRIIEAEQTDQPASRPGQGDDGRARVRVAAPTPLDIARNLAGWGALAEVIEPPAVRAELARIGAELAGRYRVPGDRSGG